MKTKDKYLVTISLGIILTETTEDPQIEDACLPNPVIGFPVISRGHLSDITVLFPWSF